MIIVRNKWYFFEQYMEMMTKKVTAAITAVGGYVPEDVLTNADIERMVDTSDEWIQSRVGIKERRILKDSSLGSSYMGIRAAKDMMERHHINAEDFDIVICSSNTPDYHFPTTASIIAEALGVPVGVPCFDFQGACPGFVYGLQIARGFVESGIYKKVLLISAEKMSAITNPKDRSTLPLFGDGAGCVVIEPCTEGLGIQDAIIGNDNHGNKKHLLLPAGGSACMPTHETVDAEQHFVYQEGQYVFKAAVTMMGDSSVEIMRRNNLSHDDIAWFVPHQANMRIIDATARRMNLDKSKVMINIQKYGNTSSATIPLCLWEWEDKLKKGDNIIVTAFGAGFTWATMYLKWGYDYKKEAQK